MPEPSYYLGVDIGTTSTKAVLFNKQGKVIESDTILYPLHTPNQLIAEQDPEEIFQAVLGTVRETIRKSGIRSEFLKLVSFSSAMHSFMAVDENGGLLTRSITWADARSAPYAKKIMEEMEGHQIYLRTGTPIHAMSPLAKLVWLKAEQPEVWKTAAKFIGIKEYIFHQLFGEYVIDHSIASATGLFNLVQLDWDKGALEIAGVDASRLAKPVPTTYQMKGLAAEYVAAMGIPEEVPFIVGASDGVLANLGVNAIRPGVIAVTIGTSGAIRTVSPVLKLDPKGRTFCYILTENNWVIGGPVNNGGIALRWLRDEFAFSEVEMAKRLGIDPYDVMTNVASAVPAGSEGLLFHPFLTGERAPLWNADARGSFFGLNLHHQKPHMIRAVLEGIVFNLYTVLLAVEELVGEPVRIQASGGFARSEMWCQLLADVFEKPVTVPEAFESSCLGAVVLGRYAISEIDDFNIVSKMIGEERTYYPDKAASGIYKELLPIYIRLSRLLAEEYESISEFQRKHLK
ncbi:gluconokinase [Planococcus shenhongbingii]|uniref:gluconokinase n=1 Tax=Planococcus shenhongbingii TaxID=3058398 RepID=UPI002636D2D5|nr:gluconokinase [Planococcus sp. N016]WKA58471.1 gluconokinase [Planococcus sp. N016]